jgi:hypothetical protein
MRLLEQARQERGFRVEQASLFAADLGPGSFTGVRVGIVMAKTFGFLFEKPCAGANAFDLVSQSDTVVLPLKRGEYFVRRAGEAPYETKELPSEAFLGYGPPDREPVYPNASRFGALLDRLVQVSAEELLPAYLVEPSISVSKRPIPGVRL